MPSATPADEQTRRGRQPSHGDMQSGTAWYGTARERSPERPEGDTRGRRRETDSGG